MEGKSLGTQEQPLQDPTSVVDFHTNIEKQELLACLRYLPEMDNYDDSIKHMLKLPSMDDNPLSYMWLEKYTE